MRSATATAERADLKRRLDFHGYVIGQRTYTNGNARVAPSIAKHFADEVGSSIDDLRLKQKARRRVNVASNAKTAYKPTNISAQGDTQLRDHVECAKPRRLPSSRSNSRPSLPTKRRSPFHCGSWPVMNRRS